MLHAVRFLFSWVYYEEKLLNEQQQFVLQGLLDTLLAVSDHTWNERNRRQLLEVADCYHLMTFVKEFAGRKTTEPYKVVIDWKHSKFILSPHAYFGRKKFFQMNRWLIRINRRLNKNPPPQRFVGVGYRDHGTCANPSFDGSPAWQEVASSPLVSSKEDYLLDARLAPQAKYSLYLKASIPDFRYKKD